MDVGDAYLNLRISIHAPSRERPGGAGCASALRSIFQSTLPRGSDVLILPRLKKLPEISIHAPSRERQNLPDIQY